MLPGQSVDHRDRLSRPIAKPPQTRYPRELGCLDELTGKNRPLLADTRRNGVSGSRQQLVAGRRLAVFFRSQ